MKNEKEVFKKMDEIIDVNLSFEEIDSKIDYSQYIKKHYRRNKIYSYGFLSLLIISIMVTTIMLTPKNKTSNDSSLNTQNETTISQNEVSMSQKIESIKALNNVIKEDKSSFNVNNEYVSSLIAFSKDISQVLLDDKNVIFSPFSIYNCISMLYEGSSGNCKAELERLLYLSSSYNLKEAISAVSNNLLTTYSQIISSSSFWCNEKYKNDINEDYLTTLANYYKAEAFSEKLYEKTVQKQIVNWINKNTKNVLNVSEDAFNFLNKETIILLLNTIFVKSQWSNAFRASSNFDSIFYGINNESIMTYMTQKNIAKVYLLNDNNGALSSLSLLDDLKVNILLPNNCTNYIDFFKNHTLDLLKPYNTNDNFNMEIYRVNYVIPQIDYKEKYNLVETLNELNVTNIFSPTYDFNSIYDKEKMYVSSMIHEASIQFSNYGVLAAAYTEISVEETTSEIIENIEDFDFILNQPFMFSLTYKDMPLFIGAYLN